MKLVGFGLTLVCLSLGMFVLLVNNLPQTIGQLCFAVNMICLGICFRSALIG